MGKVLRKDLLVDKRIIDRNSPEGERIHNFLLSRAKKLAGSKIDFEETPITFLMADDPTPNAFYTYLIGDDNIHYDDPPKIL